MHEEKSFNIWFKTTDDIFSKISLSHPNIVKEICKFSNWIIRKKISSGIPLDDLKSVMNLAVLIAIDEVINGEFNIYEIAASFKKYIKKTYRISANDINIYRGFGNHKYNEDVQTNIDVEKALNELPTKEKQAIRLYLIEEKEMLEIAEIMHTTRTSINRYIQSARKKMRDNLEAGGYKNAV